MEPSELKEPGNTPILKASELSKFLGAGSIYLKLENQNPTGSHKDRVASANLKEAKKKNKAGIAVGTCGSYGLAIAYACSLADFPCKIFIPQKYTNSKIAKISKYTSNIVFTKGSYEDAINESRQFARMHNYHEGNPFNENSDLCFKAYFEMADEIIDNPICRFDCIWLPVGNGTTLTGLYRRFQMRNYTPDWGIVSSASGSAVLTSMANQHSSQLDPALLIESEINEPLVSWLPPSNIDELIAFNNTNAVSSLLLTDAELVSAMEVLKKTEGIISYPYSAAGLAGLIHNRNLLKKDSSHLIILTS